ncbi:pancreatic triacylglycerol lipase-like [Battus philenor]|uniref:pancreatic triacylglycerol lipase-like n=1 Tax=Battus philenor TaxID=42288 RepID=UPI0035D073B9
MDVLAEDVYDLAYKSLFSGVVSSLSNLASWFDMSHLASLLVAYMALVAASGQQLFDVLGEGLQQQIKPIKHPIDETIAYIGSAQCAHVKKLFGVAYEQMEGVREPDLNSLTLWYKTRTSSKVYNISEAAATITQARAFEPDHKLIMFIHGFTDDPSKGSFTNISEALLRSGETSVIALDGSPLIRWLYLRATSYVRFMGQRLGEVLAAMVHGGTDPASIHIIGHSLGSHIGGFTGKRFHKLTGHQIGRISALDPAGPCFTHVEPDLRIQDTDAVFVDAIHTDAGVYGLAEAIGHMDYYPNSGAQQPGCLLQTCDHTRSWLYFAESVLEPSAFASVLCEDWETFKKGNCDKEISYMGYGAKPGIKGRYYLQTGSVFPYGRGADGLVYREPPGLIQAVSNVVLG